MRHVDDAHQAERDGEPEAHDQKNGGKTDTVEDVTEAVADQQKILDGFNGTADRRPHLRVGFVPVHVAHTAQRRLRPRAAEEGGGPAALPRVRRIQLQLVDRFDEDLLYRGVLFRLAHPLQHRNQRHVLHVSQPQGRGTPNVRRRAGEFDHVNRALHQRDIVLLQPHLLEAFLREDGLTRVVQQRGAGEVHEDAFVGKNEQSFRPTVQGAFLERLEQLPEGRVGEVADTLQRSPLGFRGGEILGVIGGRLSSRGSAAQRPRSPAHGDQEEEDAKQIKSPGLEMVTGERHKTLPRSRVLIYCWDNQARSPFTIS